MWVIMLLFMLSIVLTGVFVGLAWFRSPRYLWAAAAMSWILACFGALSYDVFLLILTFVLAAVALAYEAHLRSPWQITSAVILAMGLWVLAVRTVDDSVLLAPVFLIEPVLDSFLP